MTSSSSNTCARAMECVALCSVLGPCLGLGPGAAVPRASPETAPNESLLPVNAEDPETETWWALLQYWVDVNCLILGCDDAVEPLQSALIQEPVDRARVQDEIKFQVDSYWADGVPGDLTEQERADAIDALEQTRETIEQRPEELPTTLRVDYVTVIDLAIGDLFNE